MIEPGGAVALFNSGHRDASGHRLDHPRIRALVHRYAEDDPAHERRAGSAGWATRRSCSDSAFSVLDEIAVYRAAPGDAQQLVQRALSIPARRRSGWARRRCRGSSAEIEALLCRWRPTGR